MNFYNSRDGTIYLEMLHAFSSWMSHGVVSDSKRIFVAHLIGAGWEAKNGMVWDFANGGVSWSYGNAMTQSEATYPLSRGIFFQREGTPTMLAPAQDKLEVLIKDAIDKVRTGTRPT